MKLSAIKTEERLERPNIKTYNIAGYGEDNDYPQKLIDLTSASGTSLKCLNLYTKFINGDGFEDETLNDFIVNNQGLTLGKLKRMIANDISFFHGCCYHINYNANGDIAEINYCPFEYIRLAIDKDNIITGKFKYYEDWDGRKYRKIDANKIIEINPYNPESVLSEIEEVGGIDNYNGQLLWVSDDGELVYPRSICDPVISDISTEDAVATIKNRNAKNNFLPSGMLIKKGKSDSDPAKGTEDDDFEENFASWQGETNSNKIILCEIEFNEEKPEFVPFPVQNFDKEFTYTEESCQKNIGNAFNQPPVLRGELVAGKLGTANEIEEAFYYYNQVTRDKRELIEDNLQLLMKYWNVPFNQEIKIKPLIYGFTNNNSTTTQ